MENSESDLSPEEHDARAEALARSIFQAATPPDPSSRVKSPPQKD